MGFKFESVLMRLKLGLECFKQLLSSCIDTGIEIPCFEAGIETSVSMQASMPVLLDKKPRWADEQVSKQGLAVSIPSTFALHFGY